MSEICGNNIKTRKDCLDEAIQKVASFINKWSELTISQRNTSKAYSNLAMKYAINYNLNLQRIRYYNSKIQVM